jgi:hypothetical protein
MKMSRGIQFCSNNEGGILFKKEVKIQPVTIKKFQKKERKISATESGHLQRDFKQKIYLKTPNSFIYKISWEEYF